MNNETFRNWGHRIVDWLADYMCHLERYPVKPKAQPNDICSQLPVDPPVHAENMETIFNDFEKIILPGMMHWQHPMFGGYFPSSRSEVSVLAELLASGLGAQCMSWLTSPAATELEERTMEWLRNIIGLPSDWCGVIQDTASSSTLVSLLTAREQKSDFLIAKEGFGSSQRFRIYASTHAHSSVDKAVRIAGFGQNNLVKIPCDKHYALIPERLEEAIRGDLQRGWIPLAVITTLGTTATTAIDPLQQIGEIARRYQCWHHVDAAYAGSALMLDEFRWMIDGIESVDTFVVNPHKWMFVNFDCSAYFVRDKYALIRAMSTDPEYLRTTEDGRVNNYRDWGIPLGRRFRGLKLWFVLRYYGVEMLQNILRRQIEWIREFEKQMREDSRFEIMAPVLFTLIVFRFRPPHAADEATIHRFNELLLQELNNSGKIFLTHTRLDDRFVLRYAPGNLHLTEAHVQRAWCLIKETAENISATF